MQFQLLTDERKLQLLQTDHARQSSFNQIHTFFSFYLGDVYP